MSWFETLEATWPPLETRQVGPMTLRRGTGGGQRVSAITTPTPPSAEDMAAARRVLHDWTQPLLFRVEDEQTALDGTLADHGLKICDPSVILAGPVDHPLPPPLGALPMWPPVARAEELWSDLDLTPARRAIMDRVRGPKTALLGRLGDRPVGVCFAAIHRGRVMVHALGVRAGARRSGAGHALLLGAARWGRTHGADTLSMVTIRKNLPALALAGSLGMVAVGHYHYRQEQTFTGKS